MKGDWVLVSPHRLKRPWSGQVESGHEDKIPPFDPLNPLCPGVTRPNGETNPDYASTFVFENDFPALLPDIPEGSNQAEEELFKFEPARGTCRVMCFHPRSDLTIPLMSIKEIESIIHEYKRRENKEDTDLLTSFVKNSDGSNKAPSWASNTIGCRYSKIKAP